MNWTPLTPCLLAPQYHVRRPRPRHKPKAKTQRRYLRRPRESDLWRQAGERLFAAIAIMSLVALQVLGACLKQPQRTVREVHLGLGRLGGHLGRQGDGLPGLLTLWRGLRKLEVLVQGFLLAEELQRFQE